jgi:hypothetical protein
LNFPFICSNIPAAPAYWVYISLLIRYSRTSDSYHDFLDRGFLLTVHIIYWTRGSYWLSWSHHVERFTIATMTLLTIAEYLCHNWLHICSVYRNHNPDLTSFKTWFVSILKRWVPHVEQELLTLQEHMSSHMGFRWVRIALSLVFWVVFCR